MSNQCPATCHSYTSQPEAGFTYITLKEGVFLGPIAKFLSDEKKAEITALTGVKEGETLFFICDDKKNDTEKKAGLIRTWLAKKEQLESELNNLRYAACVV